MISYSIIKRFSDILFSFISIIIFLPVFFIISILIKLTSRGSIFFRQERVGQNGKIFKIYKFRSMVEQTRDNDRLMITKEDDPQITKIGKFLRKYKLDEMPQIINVLKGEMSIVGPRPEVPRYANFYTEEQKEILTVRPGMAGPSIPDSIDKEKISVGNGDLEKKYINQILPEQLFRDLEYVKHQSLWLDCKLFLKSGLRIIRK